MCLPRCRCIADFSWTPRAQWGPDWTEPDRTGPEVSTLTVESAAQWQCAHYAVFGFRCPFETAVQPLAALTEAWSPTSVLAFFRSCKNTSRASLTIPTVSLVNIYQTHNKSSNRQIYVRVIQVLVNWCCITSSPPLQVYIQNCCITNKHRHWL